VRVGRQLKRGRCEVGAHIFAPTLTSCTRRLSRQAQMSEKTGWGHCTNATPSTTFAPQPGQWQLLQVIRCAKSGRRASVGQKAKLAEWVEMQPNLDIPALYPYFPTRPSTRFRRIQASQGLALGSNESRRHLTVSVEQARPKLGRSDETDLGTWVGCAQWASERRSRRHQCPYTEIIRDSLWHGANISTVLRHF
jgi:hypothetical protein